MCEPVSASAAACAAGAAEGVGALGAGELAGAGMMGAGAAGAGGAGLGALGAGAVAGDMFLPGALGAEGAAMGTGALELGSLGAGAAAGDMYLPGALGAEGTGMVAGDAFLPGMMGSEGLGSLGGFESSMGAFEAPSWATPQGSVAAQGIGSENLSTYGGNTPSAEVAGSPQTGGNPFETGGREVFNAAKDSQAYNASQPFGNKGLSGLWDSALSAKNSPAGKGLNLMQTGSSLYDMYAKQQMAKEQMGLYKQNEAATNNMYAPGSPEYLAMERELARKDAAAGRNSQYGARAVDLQARIADIKSRQRMGMQAGQTALLNQGMTNKYSGLNSLFGYMNKNEGLASVLGG